MERLKRHGGTDVTEIALRLKVDKSVRSRWERGEVSPDWDNLFMAGTSFRVDWDGALPNNGAALNAGICRAVSEIRKVFLDGDERECDVSVLALMRFVMFGQSWLKAELANDARLKRTAVEDANRYVSQRLGAPVRRTREEILQLIEEWSAAYGLFQLLIPFDWPL